MTMRAWRVSVPASAGTRPRSGRSVSGLGWGALAALAGLLSACGYFGGSQPARAHSPSQAHAQPMADPTAKALAGMVEAVGPSGAQPPVELRFSIRDRPQVSRDDEVDYAIVPQVGGLETIRLAFGALNGLEVVSHGPLLAAIKPVSGVPIEFSGPSGAVTFQSVTGEPACSPNNTSDVTCATDSYGIAYAEVMMGATAGTFALQACAGSCKTSTAPFPFDAYILAQPTITAGQILDNASFQPVITPGSVAAIKGANLMDRDLLINTAAGYDVAPSTSPFFPLSLDGVNVSFDVPGTGISVPAPIVAVSPNQVNVVVPQELAGQTSAQVKVSVDEEFGPPIYGAVATATLAAATPAFFTNSGNVADALDTNYQVITASHAAVRGQYIFLYVNGLGAVNNPPASGAPATDNSSTTTTVPVVMIGGQQAQVQFSGIAPGLVIYQVNVIVPTNISAGNQPITIAIGGQTSASGIVIPVQ